MHVAYIFLNDFFIVRLMQLFRIHFEKLRYKYSSASWLNYVRRFSFPNCSGFTLDLSNLYSTIKDSGLKMLHIYMKHHLSHYPGSFCFLVPSHLFLYTRGAATAARRKPAKLAEGKLDLRCVRRGIKQLDAAPAQLTI